MLVGAVAVVTVAAGSITAAIVANADPAPIVVSSVNFEDGTTGTWSQSGGGTGTVSVIDIDGTKAAQVLDRNADYVGLQSPTGLFQEGKTYIFSAKIKLAPGTPDTSARFVVKEGYHLYVIRISEPTRPL